MSPVWHSLKRPIKQLVRILFIIFHANLPYVTSPLLTEHAHITTHGTSAIPQLA